MIMMAVEFDSIIDTSICEHRPSSLQFAKHQCFWIHI